MRQHFPSIVLLSQLANENVALGQLQGIAVDHLNRAMRLANAFNWTDAVPHFREAERLFGLQGDAKLVYQSKLGVMRSTTANLVIPAVLLELQDDLRNLPFLQTDRRLLRTVMSSISWRKRETVRAASRGVPNDVVSLIGSNTIEKLSP